ncbi:hypothetical protein [Streptomyces sp. NPDC018000]|uniref:hypothetical protein n=1 Tax=Streptomyces sp. NPDC018000 TaxID=3365028 RepID=UPI0037B1B840
MTDIEHPVTFHGLPLLTLPGPSWSRTTPLPAADSDWDPEEGGNRHVAVSQ